MNRRTLLRQIGAAGIATTALAGAGSATATSEPVVQQQLDVSSVEGDVTLDELLSDQELERLPADVDPTAHGFTVDADVDVIDPTACCVECKDGTNPCALGCTCCKWEVC